MEQHLQVLDRLASRQHNEAMVTLMQLDVEGKRQMIREMNLRVVVWNAVYHPQRGIRFGPPYSPFVVTAQKAPTAASLKGGPATAFMSDGIEYQQHYVWSEIAGLVGKLIVTYGEEAAAAAARDDGSDQPPSEKN